MKQRRRLDVLLVERGLVESREKGQALILAGEVFVNGQKVDKPGHTVASDSKIELAEQPRYVGRGGLKLEAALDSFRHSGRRQSLPRYRLLHRWIHGLSPAARRRPRLCDRRRNRPARLETAKRPASRGARTNERPLPERQ